MKLLLPLQSIYIYIYIRYLYTYIYNCKSKSPKTPEPGFSPLALNEQKAWALSPQLAAAVDWLYKQKFFVVIRNALLIKN